MIFLPINPTLPQQIMSLVNECTNFPESTQQLHSFSKQNPADRLATPPQQKLHTERGTHRTHMIDSLLFLNIAHLMLQTTFSFSCTQSIYSSFLLRACCSQNPHHLNESEPTQHKQPTNHTHQHDLHFSPRIHPQTHVFTAKHTHIHISKRPPFHGSTKIESYKN